jgi:hypothetical protein
MGDEYGDKGSATGAPVAEPAAAAGNAKTGGGECFSLVDGKAAAAAGEGVGPIDPSAACAAGAEAGQWNQIRIHCSAWWSAPCVMSNDLV